MVQNKEKRWRLYMNHYHGKIGGNDKWMYNLVYNPEYFLANIDKIKNINFTNDLGWGYLYYLCNHIHKNKIYFKIFEQLLRHPDIDPNLQINNNSIKPFRKLSNIPTNLPAIKLLINHSKTKITGSVLSEISFLFYGSKNENEDLVDLILQHPNFDPNKIFNGQSIFYYIPGKFHHKILLLPQLILSDLQRKNKILITFEEYRDYKNIEKLIT